jgi:acyl-coenzyme A synthetase/AMP-(fatty) acid ligase
MLPGVASEEAEDLKRLSCANEILKAASALVAEELCATRCCVIEGWWQTVSFGSS